MFLGILFCSLMLVVTFQWISEVECTGNNLLSVVEQNVQVAKGESTELVWNISIQQPINDKIVCSMKYRMKESTLKITEGKFDVERYVFKLNDLSKVLHFQERIQQDLIVTSGIQNVFKLIITNASYSDNNTFSCTLGQEVSSIDLLVYRPVSVSIPVKSVVKLSHANDTTTLTTTLCGKPKPRVTMEHYSIMQHIEGETTDSKECYTYTFSDLSLKSQTDCGQEVKLTYTGVQQTIYRKVKLMIALLPMPPQNAQLLMTVSDCAKVRWDGPNIGSCLEPTLSYDVTVTEDGSIIKQFETSSNIVNICGVDVLKKTFVTKIRCRISNATSTWTQAEIVLDTVVYDGMRTVIITCSVLFVFFVVIIAAYCCYVNKCKLQCCCCKKICCRMEKGSHKQGEDVELITVPAHQTPEITHRKASRNMSVDGTLSVIDTSILLGDTTTKNRFETPEQKYANNHNTRFDSLQRNIERERKKQEEEQKHHDEFFMPRRNTDSYLLRDIHPSYNPPDPPSSYDHDAPSIQQAPLYDILPQTRTSQSTTSTGHDDEEYSLLPRRNTDTEMLNGSKTYPNGLDPVSLYDVLPRSSTRSSRQSEQSDNSIYDAVPTGRTTFRQQNESDAKLPPPPNSKSSKNNGAVYDLVPSGNPNLTASDVDDQNNANEIIYDIPTKHNDQDDADDDYTPFSSHRTRVGNKFSIP